MSRAEKKPTTKIGCVKGSTGNSPIYQDEILKNIAQ